MHGACHSRRTIFWLVIASKIPMETRHQKSTASCWNADGKHVIISTCKCHIWAGSLLVVPAGLHKGSTNATVDNATLVYKRGEWASPFAVLKGILKV